MILHQNWSKIVKIDSKHHKLANYISNTDNCERATRLLGQRYDVYSKYHPSNRVARSQLSVFEI